MRLPADEDPRSDVDLVADVVLGDTDAYGELFLRHGDAVFSYLYRRTGDVTLAEDLTSTVFLEVWRGRARLTVVHGSVLPWLFGVANNVARTSSRTDNRARGAFERASRGRTTSRDPADQVVEELYARGLAGELRRHIAALGQADRELLSLSLYGELTVRQIAGVLGVPEGTVKSRLSRLRARVARHLAGLDAENVR